MENQRDAITASVATQLRTFRLEFSTEMLALIQGSMDSSFANMERGFHNVMAQQLVDYDHGIQRRFDKQDTEISELHRRLDQISAEAKGNTNKVENLEREVGLMENVPTARPPMSTDFDRDTDGTILRIRTDKPVSKAAVARAIEQLMRDADIPQSQYELHEDRKRPPQSQSTSSAAPSAEATPSAFGKDFIIKFTGMASTAARRAGKTIGMLRHPDGSWRDLVATTPENEDARVYVDVDKSPKQLAKERIAKKVHAACKDIYKDKEFYLQKADGKITSAYQIVAQIVVDSKDEWRVNFNTVMLRTLGLDRDQIMDRARQLLQRPNTAPPVFVTSCG